MSPSSLPTELLIYVLQYVGADEFRARITLLTVNKRWYSITQQVLFSDTKITIKNIGRFPPDHSEHHETLKFNITQLRIHLLWPNEDLGDFYNTLDKAKLYQLNCVKYECLTRILLFISECPRLRSIQLLDVGEAQELIDEIFIRNNCFPAGYYREFADKFLSPTPLPGLTGLTELYIETSYESIRHMCAMFAVQIPTLRRLYVHLYEICSEIFDVYKLQNR